MTITEIKAELYDIQYHICNGHVTFKQDGSAVGKSCTFCSRMIELLNLLREHAKANQAAKVKEEEK